MVVEEIAAMRASRIEEQVLDAQSEPWTTPPRQHPAAQQRLASR